MDTTTASRTMLGSTRRARHMRTPHGMADAAPGLWFVATTARVATLSLRSLLLPQGSQRLWRRWLARLTRGPDNTIASPMRWSGTIGLVTAGGVAILGGLIARWMFVNKTEEPPFHLEATHGALEIRVYEAQVVAETLVDGDLRPGLNEGFRRLAGYIFGGNQQGQKIAMTAPVGAQGEKIAMTAPVGAQAERGGRLRVTFVMPAGRILESLPVPNDERVTLRTVPARRVAALRFSGRATESVSREKKREALALVEHSALRSIGEPVLAQYNPPWTLPFLRRNEILIDLAE